MSAADSSYVKDVARKSGSNFYLSFFSLPKEKRDAISAVYAFCREADDAVDEPGERDPRELLSEWRAEIARTYDGHPTRPLTRSLAVAIDRFNLTRTYFDGILNGCDMDLTRLRYATFEALYGYCYHVAGEVGLLCMEIFGYRSERMKEYAVKLGLAFQLTNILRDVGTDAERGRIYIPQEDLKRFGVSEEWILRRASPQPSPSQERENIAQNSLSSQGDRAHHNSYSAPSPGLLREGGGEADAFRRLMKFEVKRARQYYQEAAALVTSVERPSVCAAEIMRAIYFNILERIERQHYDVFSARIRVPTPLKLWLTFKTWWTCR